MEAGLPLPDVVRELLKDPSVLRWDPLESMYEVVDGDMFEMRSTSNHRSKARIPLSPSCNRHTLADTYKETAHLTFHRLIVWLIVWQIQ